MAQNDMKELAIVVKADVQGCCRGCEAESGESLSNDEVRVRVIHAGVGAISKSDVDLADASNAIIIGFNVRPDNCGQGRSRCQAKVLKCVCTASFTTPSTMSPTL